MPEHVGKRFPVHGGRHVNGRPEHPQDKRRLHFVAGEAPLADGHANGDGFLQLQIADQRVRHQDARADEPKDGCGGDHELQRIRAGDGSRSEGRRHGRIDEVVDDRDPRMDGRLPPERDVRRDRFPAWDQAEHAFQ